MPSVDSSLPNGRTQITMSGEAGGRFLGGKAPLIGTILGLNLRCLVKPSKADRDNLWTMDLKPGQLVLIVSPNSPLPPGGKGYALLRRSWPGAPQKPPKGIFHERGTSVTALFHNESGGWVFFGLPHVH